MVERYSIIRNASGLGFSDGIAPETEGYYVRYSDYAALEAKLAETEGLLNEGQGDDDGMQIMPDFDPDLTIAGKVETCLHLLEKRRDIIEAQASRLTALEAAPPAPKVMEQQAELLRRLVMPMVAERSREVGDAWDKAYRVLDALTAAQESGE